MYTFSFVNHETFLSFRYYEPTEFWRCFIWDIITNEKTWMHSWWLLKFVHVINSSLLDYSRNINVIRVTLIVSVSMCISVYGRATSVNWKYYVFLVIWKQVFSSLSKYGVKLWVYEVQVQPNKRINEIFLKTVIS